MAAFQFWYALYNHCLVEKNPKTLHFKKTSWKENELGKGTSHLWGTWYFNSISDLPNPQPTSYTLILTCPKPWLYQPFFGIILHFLHWHHPTLDEFPLTNRSLEKLFDRRCDMNILAKFSAQTPYLVKNPSRPNSRLSFTLHSCLHLCRVSLPHYQIRTVITAHNVHRCKWLEKVQNGRKSDLG